MSSSRMTIFAKHSIETGVDMTALTLSEPPDSDVLCCVWESDFDGLTEWQRDLFTGIFSVLLVIALIGNVTTIVFVSLQRSKHRYVYKVFLVSLATSDFLTVLSVGPASLDGLAHNIPYWIMGKFLCKAIPFIQVAAILANSFTLCCIAVNRYRGIVHALQSRVQDNDSIAFLYLGAIWVLASGCAFPMIWLYSTEFAMVIYDLDIDIPISEEFLNITGIRNTTESFCAIELAHKNLYFTIVFMFIVTPLLLTFVVVYTMIGHFIWVRKPVGGSTARAEEVDDSPKTSQIHVERKMRTVKIIFVLMFTFLICRCPIWLFNVLDSEDNPLTYEWVGLKHSLSALSLFSCGVNPFLYAFLHDAITRGGPGCAKFWKGLSLCVSCCWILEFWKYLCRRRKETDSLVSSPDVNSQTTKTTTKGATTSACQVKDTQVVDAAESSNGPKQAWTLS